MTTAAIAPTARRPGVLRETWPLLPATVLLLAVFGWRTASSYVSRENGATCPGRWHLVQLL